MARAQPSPGQPRGPFVPLLDTDKGSQVRNYRSGSLRPAARSLFFFACVVLLRLTVHKDLTDSRNRNRNRSG